MRKTVTSTISAALLFGASSLALAASPGATDQSQLNSSGATANQSGNWSNGPSNSSDRFGNGQQSRSAPADRATGGDATLNSGTARSGASAAVTDQAQVKQQLQRQGYTNVQNVRKDHAGWTAKAKKDGQQVTVNVNSNGQVVTR